jgi:hypothetical protein
MSVCYTAYRQGRCGRSDVQNSLQGVGISELVVCESAGPARLDSGTRFLAGSSRDSGAEDEAARGGEQAVSAIVQEIRPLRH